ncbi:B3 domain-containing protein REM16-like [Telopea speciosissima]|uniref:B3 domain-containing protein REM16-like n=1 Tax=Telopea speciosissima TaxID=54955 RepID=UPI001CC66D4D|nr:B3 domain-containing protein REM16-like [Telopea speciosissima]
MEHTCKDCKRWQEYWYWNHLEPTKIRFSSLLTDGFHQGLMVIPRKIVSKFREQFVTTATLKNLSGQEFTIGLEERDGDLVFKHGWVDFINYHSLKKGDILTFQYGGDSTFTISMFDGESGYEKEALPPSLQTRGMNSNEEGSSSSSSSSDESYRVSLESEQSEGDKTTIKVETESEDDDTPPPKKMARVTRASTTSKGKSVCRETNSRGTSKRVINLDKSYSTYFKSRRRPVSISEIEQTYQLACAFPTSKPSFIVSMLPCHVYKRFFLTIPQAFVREHIPRSTKEVVLRVVPPGVKTWVTTYNGYRSYGVGLSGGWMNFVRDNNLEEGDVCVFQLTQLPAGNEKLATLAMNVKIFRVVKKITKLEKVTQNFLLK